MNKVFIWIAWILAIGITGFAFQDYLDKQWNPNTAPNTSISDRGRAQVMLEQNRQGHYIANGYINNQDVVFLLDTGATQVSVPEHIASQLNLTKMRPYTVQTANGQVTVYSTKLERLSIGNIVLDDVAAHINPGMQSDEILLGMSALKRVEFRQRGKQLLLSEY